MLNTRGSHKDKSLIKKLKKRNSPNQNKKQFPSISRKWRRHFITCSLNNFDTLIKARRQTLSAKFKGSGQRNLPTKKKHSGDKNKQNKVLELHVKMSIKSNELLLNDPHNWIVLQISEAKAVQYYFFFFFFLGIHFFVVAFYNFYWSIC